MFFSGGRSWAAGALFSFFQALSSFFSFSGWAGFFFFFFPAPCLPALWRVLCIFSHFLFFFCPQSFFLCYCSARGLFPRWRASFSPLRSRVLSSSASSGQIIFHFGRPPVIFSLFSLFSLQDAFFFFFLESVPGKITFLSLSPCCCFLPEYDSRRLRGILSARFPSAPPPLLSLF